MGNRLLAARIFDTPLLIASSKLDVILAVLGPRLGLDLPMPVASPETEAKARGKIEFLAAKRAAEGGRFFESRVAMVQITGTLANRVSGLGAMSGLSGYESIAEDVQKLADDPSVDGILLEVDSFGGEAAGCFDCADKIRAAAGKKPIFGVANQYAMSAGFALLSQADRVFVPQSGEVGSIGVVTTHMDLTKAAEKAGVKVTHVFAGKHKVDGSPWLELSDDVRSRIQSEVSVLYDQFAKAAGRVPGRLDEAGARATEAMTYIGQQAVDAKLADVVGDKAAALDALHSHILEQKQMKDLELKNAELTADKARLEARVAELERNAAAAQASEDAAYLERLRTESAKLQAPIDAEKLARVEAHLKAGRRDVAHELGDTLLEAASAKGGKPYSKQPASPPANDHQAAVVRGQAQRLRRKGFTVNISADGSRIESAIPPAEKRKE